MLTGLLLAGLLASTALPDLLMGPSPSADRDDDGEDAVPEAAETAGDEIAARTTLELTPSQGVTVIRDFVPGDARLNLHLHPEVEDVMLHDAETPDDAARLTYVVQGAGVEIVFEGLSTVPVGDIDLVLDGPQSEPVPLAEALLDLGDDPVSEPGGILPALGPVDPTLADMPSFTDPGTTEALAPTDPELADLPAGVVSGPALIPVSDPDPLSGALDQGTGHDGATLLGDAQADAGKSPVLLELDSVPAVSDVADFTPGEDLLYLSFGDVPAAELPIAFDSPSAQIATEVLGPDALVSVNGDPVLLLLNGAGIPASDIRLTVPAAQAA
ncbi:hypothetical protein LCGC14_2400030 [marine sediment metagenome]|uniref:Uncharacterized protein n=1 Tax=marine sediment metagenome TaxID=412755 RepID=A0A0F9BVQ4_9ZZZZ